MEFTSDSSTPEWVIILAEKLERGGKVGLLAFRNNSAKRTDLSPAIYIGCSHNGNSSNYATSVSDLLYSMSSVDKSVSTVPCDIDKYMDFRKVLPTYIVGKYYVNFGTLTAFMSGRVVLAVCDMSSKEIYLPDVSPDIEWSDTRDTIIEMIDVFVSSIVKMMEVNHFDNLFRDVEIASETNTHVKLLEVRAETEFDKNGFMQDCLSALKSYEVEIDKSYRTVFDNLQRDLQIAQGRGIIDALDLMTYLKERHFIFVKPNVIKYTGGKILANTGIYKDALYKTKSELWISGLRVIIENGVVVDARCYRAYHANCSGRHVCLGELVGIPIRDVHKIVDSLKVPNFSNGYWSHSPDYLGEKIADLEGDPERVWSSDE